MKPTVPAVPAVDYRFTTDELRRISEAKRKAVAEEKKRAEAEQTAAARRAGR